jgi:hypothetical protein
MLSLLTTTGHGVLQGLEAEEAPPIIAGLDWARTVGCSRHSQESLNSRRLPCRCSGINLGPSQWRLRWLPRVEQADSRIVLLWKGELRAAAIFTSIILSGQTCSSYNEISVVQTAEILSELDFGCGQRRRAGAMAIKSEPWIQRRSIESAMKYNH